MAPIKKTLKVAKFYKGFQLWLWARLCPSFETNFVYLLLVFSAGDAIQNRSKFKTKPFNR